MGTGSRILNEADTVRVRRVIGRLGIMRATIVLGVTLHVLDQARDFGRVSEKTIERLMAAVEREEAIANVA
jgi:hypothetical protein